MSTAQEYINRALRLINVLGIGETPDSQTSSDSLSALNDMLGLWSTQKLLVYQMQEETHTLVASTNSYTIGSGATIDTTRPVTIESAFIRDSSNYDSPLRVINKAEYDRISMKGSEASYPERLFYDPGFSNGTIYLYPTPSTANTLHFTSWKPFSTFATLATSATFPPGYNQLLVYNLAVLLGAEFNAQVRPDVLKIALDTRAQIETLNNRYQSDVTTFDLSFSKRPGDYRELL